MLAFVLDAVVTMNIGYFISDPYPIPAKKRPKYPWICGQLVSHLSFSSLCGAKVKVVPLCKSSERYPRMPSQSEVITTWHMTSKCPVMTRFRAHECSRNRTAQNRQKSNESCGGAWGFVVIHMAGLVLAGRYIIVSCMLLPLYWIGRAERDNRRCLGGGAFDKLLAAVANQSIIAPLYFFEKENLDHQNQSALHFDR